MMTEEYMMKRLLAARLDKPPAPKPKPPAPTLTVAADHKLSLDGQRERVARELDALVEAEKARQACIETHRERQRRQRAEGLYYRQLYEATAQAEYWSKQLDDQDVNATIDALKAATNLPTKGNPMPGWLGSGAEVEEVRELVACQNGILHMPTRKLTRHTPRFWSPNVLDFGYNPRARAPRFKQFLEEVWPGEPQTQQCLLEMFSSA